MKIKSLLLGSAAALATVSGAQAADAIMAAAPEPVEYVRVCDAFGTGYFYIPGTETCLKLSGFVRQDFEGGELRGTDGPDRFANGDSWYAHTRFEFHTDTKQDTELGVLHTYTELRFNWDNEGANSVDVNEAYIELGGFLVGMRDSAFTTWTGYAGGVIVDTPVAYGPFSATQISYTYRNPNGFSAFIGVEDDVHQSEDTVTIATAAGPVEVDEGNYIPDVVGGLGWDGGAFQLRVVGGYDESLSEGAIKARADATFGRVTGFVMAGWSSNGDDSSIDIDPVTGEITFAGSNDYATWGGDWAVWGGLSTDLTERVGSNIQLSYDDDDTFAAAANLVFHVVPGFDVTTEVDYIDFGEDTTSGLDLDGDWGGVIRFQRTF